MARHEVLISHWYPARLNEFVGKHWAVGHRLKRRDRELVCGYAHALATPPADGKRRVSLVVTLPPGQRSFDKDSLWKSALDALVCAGLLVDDSPKWCALGPVEYDRGANWGTLIVLEDVG